jgi:signal transduction histidine kinase
VFLAFPSGRLSGRFERSLVAAAYATAISLELVRMVFGGFGPNNLLEVSPNPAVADQVLRIQLVLVSAYCLAGVGVLALRRFRAGRPRRRSLALLIDAFALALVMIAFLFLSAALDGPAVAQIRWATFAALGLAPLAFLIGLLHSRLARSAAGELLVELRDDPEPADLRDALARALRDPSLALAYWLPEFERWADLDGHEVRLPAKDSARATTRIDREGDSVAVLVHDPSLDDEPELLAAVSAGAAIALEHGRLHAELRARLGELRGSRARVLEAGQKERQRLERNLHDGAQQRLIALSLDLGLLEERLGDDLDAAARLHLARQEIALSLGELRDVARGLHPAVVSGHGLAVALESLAAHAAVPVRLTVALEGRVREQVEVAAYYVVAESLTNVGKHARAKSATVDVARVDGQVVVEVVDDGMGGADTERGSGLRGLADRVESLGGRLRVWTPRGGGTRVRAELPCV